VRLLPPRVLGSAVGGVIVVTTVRTLLNGDRIAAPAAVGTAVYVAPYALRAAAITCSVRAQPRERDAVAESDGERQPVSA